MISPLDLLSIETWILLFTIIFAIRYYIHRQWQVLKKYNIPHEPPSILGLGNLRDFAKDPDAIFNQQLAKKKQYGMVYGSYVALQTRITIADPAILKKIFIKEFPTFVNRQVTFSYVNGKEMNTGLTAVKGDHWKRIRNTISPTFSTSKLKEMLGFIGQCADHMVENLQLADKDNKGRFLAKDVFGKYSLDVICSAAFSVNIQSQDSTKEPKTVKLAKKLFDRGFGYTMFLLFFMFPTIERIAGYLNYSLFPADTVAYFAGLVDRLIKNKDDKNARVDLLRHMLDSQISEDDVRKGADKGLTRNEIVGNSMLMILAGYETTGNTLITMCYNLAAHPEAQGRLRREVDDAIRKHGGLTYEATSELKYMQQCLNETLRLYPAVPMNSRYSEREITIDGVTIPAGIHVNIPSYGLSHDEEYWDEPWKFYPDRFEDMSKINPIVFQPFGVGPRNCIGQRLARIEIYMGIAKLLANFELQMCNDTPKPPLEMTFKSSMRPKEDIFLRVIPRIKN